MKPHPMHRTLLILWLMSQAALAGASPTANEFERCHKIASAMLEMCLNKNTDAPAESCWDAAKRSNLSCYQEVKASHTPGHRKTDAEKTIQEKKRNQSK